MSIMRLACFDLNYLVSSLTVLWQYTFDELIKIKVMQIMGSRSKEMTLTRIKECLIVSCDYFWLDAL